MIFPHVQMKKVRPRQLDKLPVVTKHENGRVMVGLEHESFQKSMLILLDHRVTPPPATDLFGKRI